MIKIDGHGSVRFWMQRVAEEYRSKAIELIKEADTLHYQTVEIENMSNMVQKNVVEELASKMIELGWEKEVKEYLTKDQ